MTRGVSADLGAESRGAVDPVPADFKPRVRRMAQLGACIGLGLFLVSWAVLVFRRGAWKA
jgi:hypothetical protein